MYQDMRNVLVSVVTASTGKSLLERCMLSVQQQTHHNVQHLTFSDGPQAWQGVADAWAKVGCKPSGYRNDVVELPYSVGKDRWNGHRQYGAGTYLADGDYIMFLDDDNYLEEDHIEKCLEVIKAGNTWAYSLRNVVDDKGTFICKDDCESLGKWASIIHPDDYFVDVNCYFLPRHLAVTISPLWFCKFREPGQPEIDRKLAHALRQLAPKFDSSYDYTVNYTVGNTNLSVQREFFENGNKIMLERHNGVLPWKKNNESK